MAYLQHGSYTHNDVKTSASYKKCHIKKEIYNSCQLITGEKKDFHFH